ncbi:hypothetical protein A8C32_10030 [Flavivirga aquatica]|uniref:Toxin VasX N-terminal region domain-containing protein n=1 Tax=Flavivirga aquatica TaxID=1849968 RepID=A0A1E5TEP2_9FLAO|nr:toxin VasX [Flavivirga aquatica]OEK09840.1 hypothetical protein A8C32_10030 [Flavivirga aquatica]
MANKKLQVTAVYVTEDEPVIAKAVNKNATGFQVISIDGPYDKPGGKKIEFVDKTKQYVYYITIDGDTSMVDRGKINWAVSYDGEGLGNEYIIEDVNGGRIDKNRLWLYINSQLAEKTFTIYAYTGSVPTKGSSITVSIDHAQYKADILNGDRCSVPSNTTIVTDEPTPTADQEFELQEGLRLYFLRYGFFLGDKGTNHKNDEYSLLNNEGKVSPYYNGLKLKGFHCHATELNLGYIYIINPDKATPKDSFEYEILPQQKLFEIPWHEKEKRTLRSSLRKQRNSPAPYHIIPDIEEVKQLYACFSPMQWSAEYYKKMCDDAALREERMTLIYCEPFSPAEFDRKTKYSKIYSYVGFSAVFPEANFIGYNRLKKRRERIAKHYKPDSEKILDLFVPLHDAIGCAEDMAFHLDREVIYHRANLEAIRYGECIDDVVHRIINGDTKTQITPEEQKISDMFSLALTSYQMVYNNAESIGDYDGGEDIGAGFIWHDGKGVYKPKLLKVLDVEGRKAQRQKIRDIQNDFGTYIQSNWFNHFTTDFYQNSDICNFTIKPVIARYLSNLALNPHDIDRALDLKRHQENDSPWEDFVKECVAYQKPRTSIQSILDYQIDITPEFEKLARAFNIGVIVRFSEFINKMLDSMAKIITKTSTRNLHVLVKRLNAKTVYGVKVFDLQAGEIRAKIPKNATLIIDPEDIVDYKGKNNYLRVRQDANSVKLLNKKTAKTKKIIIPIEQTEEYAAIGVKRAEKIGKFLNHDAFKGCIAGLQVLNLGVAISSFDDSTKSYVNLVGVIAEFSEALLNFKKVNARVAAFHIMRQNIGRSIVKVVPMASAGITVIMCGWDAYDSFGARDDDAALAFAGAALAFSGVTITTVGTTTAIGGVIASNLGIASLLGPIGWICAGIGVGLLVLAYYLKDTSLETYFKHYMFSDAIASPVSVNLPAWQHNLEMYQKRKLLMGENNTMMYLEDPTRASAELYDLIVCSDISYKQSNFTKPKTDYSWISNTTTITKYAMTFTVEVSFRQFFRTKEQFKYELYYYPYGIKRGSEVFIAPNFMVTHIEGNAKTPPKARVVINISEKLANKANAYSCLLFVCRLHEVQDGMDYPIVYNGVERHLGAIISIQNIETIKRTGASGSARLFKENVRIAPKTELINGNAF